MYAHGLFGASARARKACQPKIKEELLNMFPSKHRETKQKISGRANTLLSAQAEETHH